MRALRRAGAALWAAWSFLTILPPACPRPPGDEEPSAALAFFPLVGAVVGALAGGAVLLASRFAPPPLVAVVAVGAPLALTGALHFDGLLDASDGAFAPRTPERRREIMRDSRVGSFAVVTGVLVLLAFYACALSLTPLRLALALIVAGAAGRAAAVLAVVRYPYGREHGAGRDLHGRAAWPAVAMGLVLALAAAALGSWRGIAALLAALAAGAALAELVARRLGGTLTGDAYGFCEQFAELAALLAFVVR
ncbi:adenosylcobinamide-GDP ribazoletransferase [bacterium]|nr:MAG: adenosylcobinamide-GDP ribazoletransferase [bacterium]